MFFHVHLWLGKVPGITPETSLQTVRVRFLQVRCPTTNQQY